jgi:hypothetical protein
VEDAGQSEEGIESENAMCEEKIVDEEQNEAETGQEQSAGGGAGESDTGEDEDLSEAVVEDRLDENGSPGVVPRGKGNNSISKGSHLNQSSLFLSTANEVDMDDEEIDPPAAGSRNDSIKIEVGDGSDEHHEATGPSRKKVRLSKSVSEYNIQGNDADPDSDEELDEALLARERRRQESAYADRVARIDAELEVEEQSKMARREAKAKAHIDGENAKRLSEHREKKRAMIKAALKARLADEAQAVS